MNYSFGDWEKEAGRSLEGSFETDKVSNFAYLRECGLSTKPYMSMPGSDLGVKLNEVEQFCAKCGSVAVRAIPTESGLNRKFSLDLDYDSVIEFLDRLERRNGYTLYLEAYQKGEFSGNIVAREDGSVIIESFRGDHPNVAYGKVASTIYPGDEHKYTEDKPRSFTSFISWDGLGTVRHPSCLTEKERKIIWEALGKIKMGRGEYQPGYYEWVYDDKWGLQFIDAIMDEGYTR